MEEKIFLENIERNKKFIGIIHRVYLTQLKNARIIKAFTKTKAEVRGGGKKPWRQKGTGNARAGSIRSPLFVGGGVIFGPKFRECSKKINKKEKKLAILAALYLKKSHFIFIEDDYFMDLSSFKTKLFIKKIIESNINPDEKTLIILPKIEKNLQLAVKNLKNIQITTINCLNLKQLLYTKNILLSKLSLKTISQIYGKQYV
jgi:large subunit ribosomal protein L4